MVLKGECKQPGPGLNLGCCKYFLSIFFFFWTFDGYFDTQTEFDFNKLYMHVYVFRRSGPNETIRFSIRRSDMAEIAQKQQLNSFFFLSIFLEISSVISTLKRNPISTNQICYSHGNDVSDPTKLSKMRSEVVCSKRVDEFL